MAKHPPSPIHGWLVLDKPLGLTSTQALGRARRLLGGNKVGHGGTLDPLATGILPLAFGEATKLIPYLMDGKKDYDFTIRWGESRDTEDAEGRVTATSALRPTAEDIRAALPSFIGTIQQIPPVYSAIKCDGERAYDLARAGEAPALAARPVVVQEFDVLATPDADHTICRVRCGKGTYVRALARDLAAKLGICGHITALRRMRVGPFTLADAISLEKLAELRDKDAALTALQTLRAALDDIPGLTLTASEAQRVRSGQGFLIRAHQVALCDAKVIFAEHAGVPVALLKPEAGEFRVVRGFHF